MTIEEEKALYINVSLDAQEQETLQTGKEKSGIKSNTDFIRFLITQYARS